jgi:hypothetical protein
MWKRKGLRFYEKMKDLDVIFRLLEKKKRKNLWVQKVETSWTPPPGLFTKEPEEIAQVLHDESPDYATAVRRLYFYYNRSGVCEEGGKRWDPKECSKRKKVHELLKQLFGVEESLGKAKTSEKEDNEKVDVGVAEEEMDDRKKEGVPVPGTQRYLIWVSRLFISPNRLARAIYKYYEDFSGYPGVPPRIIVRNRFYAIARSLVYVSGICFPDSPLYRSDICDKIEIILSEAFVRYYSLISNRKRKPVGNKKKAFGLGTR